MQKLIDTCITNESITIAGMQYSILGMAKYASANYPDDSYYKLSLNDHSGILIIPGQNRIYRSKTIGKIPDISDAMVGTNSITFESKEYSVVNANDYQFVLEIHIGLPKEVEGECKFSDYESIDPSRDMISLGWISFTGKRADVHATIIDRNSISF